MSDSAWERRANTTTIKFGKGYEAPWLVLSGSVEDMRKDLITAMGWDAGEQIGRTLVQLIAQASAEVTGTQLVTANLGGRVVSKSAPEKPQEPISEPSSPEADDSKGAVLEELQSASTLTDLKRIWVESSTEINAHDELKKAFAAAKVRIEKEN